MSDDTIKLVAKLPKGELNGFAFGTLAEGLCTQVEEGRAPVPLAAVLLLDVKKVEIDPDTGERTAHLQVRRAQPVLSVDSRRKVEEVLFDEYAAEHGPVLPYDVQAVTRAAFRDLPRSAAEVDQREAQEQEVMTPSDELRKHLERVHGADGAHLLTDGEAEERHRKDHEGDLLSDGLGHDPSWHAWTRAELEIAAAAGLDEED
jgi:hypothetical protein